jgi:hypothetical protein
MAGGNTPAAQLPYTKYWPATLQSPPDVMVLLTVCESVVQAASEKSANVMGPFAPAGHENLRLELVVDDFMHDPIGASDSPGGSTAAEAGQTVEVLARVANATSAATRVVATSARQTKIAKRSANMRCEM